ncbi:MAG: M3 family oligoendopeptidase [Anaerolineales bacterium]|nr:M3 family oligoendopeptidase [Chloroflexota bacterium]MBL6981299.1 M3 family oligoendopeptidase [Anaerolineales bacterium]
MSEYKLSPWSLKDLFPSHDGPEIEAAFMNLEAKADEFEAFREKLTPEIDFEDFMDAIKALEEATIAAYNLSAYPGLWFAADTQSQDAQALYARVQQFMAKLQNQTLFFSLWWKNLDVKVAEKLMSISDGYTYWLEEMRHFKPHILSEPEEKIVNIKDVTGAQALVTLYDAITNRYVFKLEVDGEVKEMTRGELTTYVQGADADLRAAAYQEMYRVYGDDGPILGQMYQTLMRDWFAENIDLRGYDTPISVRNLVNDVPDDVAKTLMDVCEANANVFQRYFKIKAKWLGVDKLSRYDIYAPIAEADKTFDYDEAVKLTLKAFEDFEPRVAELAKQVFDDDHIDSEVRKGKQSGAFCASTVPGHTPYVKVNYQGKISDVGTIAHELGHAIHSMLAFDHNVFTFHSSLPMAENASTFAEMLLIDRLLEIEDDPAVRRDILFRQVDDAYATIMRQAFFAMFEVTAHDLVAGGATIDQLSEAYMENIEKQFGDAVELSDEFKWEWVSIPHFFHYPFYVYAYAFGQLLVFSLYKQFKAEGNSFKPRYIKILEAGGSASPADICAEAGLDITEAEFWQGGFDVIKEMVEQLEAIPVE